MLYNYRGKCEVEWASSRYLYWLYLHLWIKNNKVILRLTKEMSISTRYIELIQVCCEQSGAGSTGPDLWRCKGCFSPPKDIMCAKWGHTWRVHWEVKLSHAMTVTVSTYWNCDSHCDNLLKLWQWLSLDTQIVKAFNKEDW